VLLFEVHVLAVDFFKAKVLSYFGLEHLNNPIGLRALLDCPAFALHF